TGAWAKRAWRRAATWPSNTVGRKASSTGYLPWQPTSSAAGLQSSVRAHRTSLMAATKTIPIVFVTASDPVAAGFGPSLGRPEGNVTGIPLMGTELVAKRLELLHDLLPAATRIAVLVNPNNPGLTRDNIQQSEAAIRRLGLEMIVLKAGTESEI